MTRHRRWLSFAALVTAAALALGAPAGGQTTTEDERDALIARLRAQIAEQEAQIEAQEAQLNEYRCRFDVDVHLVLNGCSDPVQPPPEEPPPVPAGTIEAQWERLRQCNANGNYQYSNPNGVNHGVYEFRQSTWNRLARLHYPHLVGVKPSDAAPADQDRMAYRLYEELGWAPWPQCGASLPSLVTIPTFPTNPSPGELPPLPAGTTQAQWDHLIKCESGGNYRAYNPAGPYLGAFQFHQPTWNGVASRHYPNLVGVDPRNAAPADQHRMAYRLYEERGWQPWPVCGAPFR